MKLTSRIGIVLAALAASSAVMAEAPPPGGTARAPAPIKLPVLNTVNLSCSGSGASDVAQHKHSIKNTTSYKIPKGTKLLWSTSKNTSGSLTISSDLAPGAEVSVIEPGQTNGYSCTAKFAPGAADLVVSTVKWIGTNTAQVEVSNTNPWTDAPASKTTIQSLKCLATLVTSKVVDTPSIAKGQKNVLTVSGLPKAQADYLKATANTPNGFSEKDSSNNSKESAEFDSNNSCTAQ